MKKNSTQMNVLNAVEYGAVAQQFAEARNYGAADIALKNLKYDPNDPITSGFAELSGIDLISDKPNSPQSIMQASRVFAKKYFDALSKVDATDLPVVYGGVFNSLGKDAQKKISSMLKGYNGKTVLNMDRASYDSNKVLEREDLHTVDEITLANTNNEKNQDYVHAYDLLSGLNMQKLTRGIEDKVTAKALENLVKTN